MHRNREYYNHSTVLDCKDVRVKKGEASNSSHTRDSILAIDEKQGQKYRVKSIKYGNQRVSDEIVMEKLFSLTGLSSPRTKYAVNFDREFSSPSSGDKYGVASPYLKNFKDLGVFLVTDAELFIADDKAKRIKYTI